MASELSILAATALSLGFIHTLLGPDHYLPFIAMAKAGKWSTARTAWVTVLCGLGHVGSSVLLGFVGIAFGLAVARLEAVESARGNIAGWVLIVAGLLYTAWGLRRAGRSREHVHEHAHPDGTVHAHTHRHATAHLHAHGAMEQPRLTPWILFTIFIFGPCEPLIPLVMYPAAKHHLGAVAVVSLVFGLATIGTMLLVVLGTLAGLRFAPAPRLGRYAHALAGASLLLCGLAVQFLGL